MMGSDTLYIFRFWKYIFSVIAVFLVFYIPFTFFTNTSKTIYNEFSSSAMLEKYEWFKDASSILDKKLSDIDIYQDKLDNLTESYKDIPRREWDRTDKETWNIWSQELAGIKSSYNRLAAEFNSNKSKFNWEKFEGDEPIEYKKLQ